MSREDARKKLAGTWRFQQVRGEIVLRDVALVEAVLSYELSYEAAQLAPHRDRVVNQPPRAA